MDQTSTAAATTTAAATAATAATTAAREAGAATTELVVLFPALLTLLFVAVQFGIWYHDGAVVRAAAAEGVRAARVESGTAAAGQRRAEAFLASAGKAGLERVTVTGWRDDANARIEVTGYAASLLPIPGLRLPVRGVAQSPLERFIPLHRESP
jgi:Flp pilus assembly protein TadG